MVGCTAGWLGSVVGCSTDVHAWYVVCTKPGMLCTSRSSTIQMSPVFWLCGDVSSWPELCKCRPAAASRRCQEYSCIRAA